MHATSPDLVHWKHVGHDPSLVPMLAHDEQGVFSGCMLTHGPKGEDGVLTAIYTAVSHLPIHFSKAYHWGSEKLALAVSLDGGRHWHRDASSIILPGPPEELKGEVISWRDPFVSPWPEMDDQLGVERDQYLYGLISGGLKDRTPTAFLYQIPRDNLRRWTFISTVAEVGLHFRLDERNAEMGQNWEVCNFFSMHDRQYLLMNVEGAGDDAKGRHAMWTSVDMQGSQLVPRTSGLVDHGCLYAATTFLHGPSQRRILWGWVTEDDLAESRYQQQGWSGCMALPRELVSLTYRAIDGCIATDAYAASQYRITPDEHGSLQLQTLGWRPVAETAELRKGARHLLLRQSLARRLPIQSRNMELQVDFSTKGQEEAGVLLCHNPSLSQYTKIVFRSGAIHVDRSQSTRDMDVTTTPIVAPLALLPFADGTTESVQMRIFLDNSVLEVFVNDRVAITTRIYCDDDEAVHVSLFHSYPPHAHFDRVEAWVGLQSAMSIPSTDSENSKL